MLDLAPAKTKDAGVAEEDDDSGAEGEVRIKISSSLKFR